MAGIEAFQQFPVEEYFGQQFQAVHPTEHGRPIDIGDVYLTEKPAGDRRFIFEVTDHPGLGVARGLLSIVQNDEIVEERTPEFSMILGQPSQTAEGVAGRRVVFERSDRSTQICVYVGLVSALHKPELAKVAHYQNRLETINQILDEPLSNGSKARDALPGLQAYFEQLADHAPGSTDPADLLMVAKRLADLI